MDDPSVLLGQLRRVSRLRFDAHSEAGTGWDGVGTGTVVVTEPATGVVLFTEAGTWQPRDASRKPFEFKNVFRWSLVADGVRLEHLRFGPEHPVLLFDLASDVAGVWRPVTPHQCREDCYSATLTLTDDGLVLAWSIVGPRKRETIRYTYLPSGAGPTLRQATARR